MLKEKLLLDMMIPKLIENLTEKGVNVAKEKIYINKLKESIREFNTNFDNTELDCGSFQRFIEDEKNLEKIFNHLNNVDTIERISDKEFVHNISNEAFEFVNREKHRIGHPSIEDKAVFEEYFNDLIAIIDNFIFSQLKLEGKQITNLIIGNAKSNTQTIIQNADMRTNQVLSELGEIKELLLTQSDTTRKSNNIELSEGVIANNKLMQSLTDSDIAFDSETKIILDSNEGDVKGEFIVKYNDFLANFNSVNGMLNYLYFTRKTIELEPVEFRTMVGDKIIQEWKTDEKYDGKVVKLEFTSYGEMLIIEQRLKETMNQIDCKSKLILCPQDIDEYLKVDLENEDFDTILSNIIFKIQERRILDNNHIVAILSNKGQEDSYIYVELVIEMKDGTIISTKINIKPMKKNKVIYNLKCSMLMKKLEQSTKLYVRKVEDNSIAFEAYIKTQRDKKYIQKDIELMKTIMFIEKELNVEFDLPNRIKNVEIDDIFTLLEIIKSGKVKFPVSSLTFTFDENTTLDKLSKNDKLMFHFTSNDKYEIFNKEIDLGEQLIVLPKVIVKDLQKNKLTIESLEGSNNLIIYKKYYGDHNIEEIFEKEDIGRFGK